MKRKAGTGRARRSVWMKVSLTVNSIAFNPFTTKPPVMFFDGQAIAYLTMNTNKGPALDTNSVLRCVGRQ